MYFYFSVYLGVWMLLIYQQVRFGLCILAHLFKQNIEFFFYRSLQSKFLLDPVLYDNWLFITLFLFPPKKRGKNKRGKI